MSREIKLRYVCVRENGFVFSKVFTLQEIENGAFATWKNINSAASGTIHKNQFTGLKDKNGKEVYEGDIVYRHIEFWSDPADIGGKRFVKRDLVYFIEWGKWCYIKRDKQDSPCTSFDGIEAKEFEVIGNIYENTELLNKETDDERGVTTDAK